MAKKILCLIDSLGPGGAQRQLVGLATLLKEKGYDIIVTCYHDNRFYVDTLLTNGVSYIYMKKAGNTFFRIWHVARYIRKVKPDIVISYLETPSICASVARIFNHSFSLIVSERNTTQHTGRNEKIRFNLFRIADYVVPNAFAQEKYIKEVFPFLSSKVITIPNFVDLDYFTSPNDRKRKSIPEIMIAASIWPSKNTIGFIEAVAELKKKVRDFHISWYGKDISNIDYFNECQRRIAELNVEDVIELKEKTQKIRDKYNDADYFCLPSFYEGTPNVICEALSSGLPVVCSDICDNRRYVKEGENGFLFNPVDTTSMQTAIYHALSINDSEYDKFCKYSRLLAEKSLSKDNFVESYIKLIES